MEIVGVKIMSDVYEWDGLLESGKIGIKQWRSDDFPGRVLRNETDYRDSTKSTSKEFVVSLVNLTR